MKSRRQNEKKFYCQGQQGNQKIFKSIDTNVCVCVGGTFICAELFSGKNEKSMKKLNFLLFTNLRSILKQNQRIKFILF